MHVRSPASPLLRRIFGVGAVFRSMNVGLRSLVLWCLLYGYRGTVFDEAQASMLKVLEVWALVAAAESCMRCLLVALCSSWFVRVQLRMLLQ